MMDIESLLWAWLMPILFALLDLTALALALIFYRRCPAACGLVVSAALLGLAGGVLRLIFTNFGNMDDENRLARTLVFLALAGMSWLSYGLMIVAVFMGRRPPEETSERKLQPLDDDDDWGRPASTEKAPTDTGIRTSLK